MSDIRFDPNSSNSIALDHFPYFGFDIYKLRVSGIHLVNKET